MNLPTIRVSPTDYPKFNFLQRHNFLGEYKTEVDKARVRFNLGIPDSYSFKWGNIGGAIQNQPDLANMLNNITRKLNNLELQINGLSGTINTILGEFDTNITTKSLYSEVLKLLIDVAQNSRDIANIVTGGNSDLLNRVNTNTTNISLLQSRIDGLNTSIQNISNYDDSEIRNNISNLLSLIIALQHQLSVNELTGITLSLDSINAQVGTSDLTIIITAHYTKSNDLDVTDSVICNSSNSNVAYWSNNKVIIAEAGVATLTFTYEGKTAQLNVTIASESNPIAPQYVGYANSYQQVFLNNQFACDTIAGTWTSQNTPVFGEAPYAFYIITTLNINTVGDFIASYNIQDIVDLNNPQITDNQGRTYNVYKIAPLFDTNTDIIITIQ